jgi:hypothetical protein
MAPTPPPSTKTTAKSTATLCLGGSLLLKHTSRAHCTDGCTARATIELSGQVGGGDVGLTLTRYRGAQYLQAPAWSTAAGASPHILLT